MKKIKPSEEERKKKKKSSENQTSEKQEEDKKKVSWSKGAAEWVPHVCLITKIPLSYELWKLKIVKMCFQFP